MTTQWPHFLEKELRCKCGCGKSKMDVQFMSALELLRTTYGKPMIVTSGYRCPAHNGSVSSTGDNGPHTQGKAVDIKIHGKEAHRLLTIALQQGFKGVGLKQVGDYPDRFIHLDMCDYVDLRPYVWTY
jgi:zinc D-Ala-D-Ala carboxypeptidase